MSILFRVLMVLTKIKMAKMSLSRSKLKKKANTTYSKVPNNSF